MTDLITRARKEWVEAQATVFPVVDAVVYTQEMHCPCPPDVIAALLDVLDTARQGIDPYEYRSHVGQAAEAAIAKALEEK